jgi:hypothetical protein
MLAGELLCDIITLLSILCYDITVLCVDEACVKVYNYVCKSIDGNLTRVLRRRRTDLSLFSGGVFISFARSHSESMIFVPQHLVREISRNRFNFIRG